MPVVFTDLPKRVVRTVRAIAVADGLRVEDRIIGLVPMSVLTDPFTYTTLNYHIVPAFLHCRHAMKDEALTVPTDL